MPRFITCVTNGSSKKVKIYEENDYPSVLKKIRENEPREYRIKYVRNLEAEELPQDTKLMLYWREHTLVEE
jgi:hypothetical protein